MEFECFRNHPPGDPALVDKIVCQLKSQGIFDQFRKECISDVDTKPAYQNLRQRVDFCVNGFLANQEWKPDLNKNQLRESLRKHVQSGGFLEVGVERIVDQVVNPKIFQVFLPEVKEVVYECLGIKQPKSVVGSEMLRPSASTTLTPPKIETHNLGLNVDNNPTTASVTDQPTPTDNFTPRKTGKVSVSDAKNNSSSSNPLIDSDNSLDSHVSGITELASHSSLNVSKESNASEDKDAIENNDIMNESALKSEDSNVDSIFEALGLPQSDTNTNISAFDSDSIPDLHEHLKSENDESFQNDNNTPMMDDIDNSDEDMSLLNSIGKEELLGNVSDFSKNDSDGYNSSIEDYNGLKNSNWEHKYKEKSEKESEKNIERKKYKARKRQHSEHKKEPSFDSFDIEEKGLLKSDSDTCAVKSFNEKFESYDDKINKSSDDEKERKEQKITPRYRDKSKSIDKECIKDNHNKAHLSKGNQIQHHHYYPHHHHSSKEKSEKEFSRENSRDSRDGNASNNIDKNVDTSKSRGKSRDDHKSTSRLHDRTNRCKENGKEKEHKKSESSDSKHKDSSKSRQHRDSKSKSEKNESDSKHSHHYRHRHNLSNEEKRELKEKFREDSKEYEKDSSKDYHKEAFRNETIQNRDVKDVDGFDKRKDDSCKSRSRDEKREHHSSSSKEKRNNQDSLKSSKPHSESRKDEKKLNHKSHNQEKEKTSSKYDSEMNKQHYEEKSYEKHEEKHKRDERSKSKKSRDHCKSSKRKEDRRSTDRDSSGSGDRGSRSSGIGRVRLVDSSHSEKKDKESVGEKNVSGNSASDDTEVCMDELVINDNVITSDHRFSYEARQFVTEVTDNARKIISDSFSDDCRDDISNDVCVQKIIESKNKNDSIELPDGRKEVCKSEATVDNISADEEAIMTEAMDAPDSVVANSSEIILEETNKEGFENVFNRVIGNSLEQDVAKATVDFKSISEDKHYEYTEKILQETCNSVGDRQNVPCSNNDLQNLPVTVTCEGSTEGNNSELINLDCSEMIKSTVSLLKNSILARMKQHKDTFSIYEENKLRLLRKNMKKIEQIRLNYHINYKFCYFRHSELIEAKEKLKCFNCVLDKIDNHYNSMKNIDTENLSVKELGGLQALKVSNASHCYRLAKSVNTIISEEDHRELRTVEKEQEIIQNNLNVNETVRYPVKLRISVKNPNDCKVIEVKDISKGVRIEGDATKASDLKNDTMLHVSGVSNFSCSSDYVRTKENSIDNSSVKKDCSEGMTRKRGYPKKKGRGKRKVKPLIAKSTLHDIVQDVSFVNSNVTGKRISPNIDISSVKRPHNLQQMNPVMQTVDSSKFSVGQVVSPMSPPSSANGSCSYAPLCSYDAAIPNDGDITKGCILRRSDKSNNYKTLKSSSDSPNYKSADQYSPSPKADKDNSHNMIKNVDIISPNRLNNNLSDNSDCAEADDIALNENENDNYLLNPLIGEALKDLMQESGMIEGTKVPLAAPTVTRLKTKQRQKKSASDKCVQQENCNISLNTRGRLSGNYKQTQRYDNSDLYKPRLRFRQNKRKYNSDELPKDSGEKDGERGYSSSAVGRPSKRAR